VSPGPNTDTTVVAGANDSAENAPAAISFSGDWIGNVFGTNTGKVYVRIAQQGRTVSGEVRLMDDTSGPNVFAIAGTADKRLVAELTPTQIPERVQATPGNVELELGVDGRLHGRWATKMGTGGVVTLARFTLPSQTNAQDSVPQVLTPLRVFNDSEPIGAIRLGEDGVRRIVEVVQQDFSTSRAVVTFRPKGRRLMTAYADDFLARSPATSYSPMTCLYSLAAMSVGTTRSAPVTHQVQDVWHRAKVPRSCGAPETGRYHRLSTWSNPVLGSSGGRLGENSGPPAKDVRDDGHSDLMVASQLPA